jgi:hypothetical protein
MKHRRPDQRIFELGNVWHVLTTDNRNSWLRLARVIGGKQTAAGPARLMQATLVLALALMLCFPFSLRSAALAIGAGYVLAVNLAIVRVCFEGVRAKWNR